ncbi:MAG TPA: hypothetical protein VNU93_02350, partial [Verrucomicrobiae bacterium]|nr:hypothetical protein [Verrucomicrobiae bacterium]
MFKQPAKAKFFLALSLCIFLTAPALTLLTGCSTRDKAEISKQPEPSQQITKSNEAELKQQAAEVQKRQEALDKQKLLDGKYQTAYQAFHAKKRTEAIKLADEIIQAEPNYYQAYN